MEADESSEEETLNSIMAFSAQPFSISASQRPRLGTKDGAAPVFILSSPPRIVCR